MSSGVVPPRISIIVVSYNTRDMTLDCLRSIAAQTRIPHEVILIDNASTDGSAEAVRAAHPGVRLMAETTNHGFASANNIAALKAQGEYILLLNPDTVVLDGAIDRLLAFAGRRPEAMIWGGRTLFGDGRLNPGSCFGRMTLWTVLCRSTGLSGVFRKSPLFNPEDYGGWARDSEREVDIVCGCFLLLPARLWRDLGGFDLRFVMYGEEADLCLRARELGARPRITPDAQIVHYGGASETVRADKMVRLYKAKTLLILRHFPSWQRAAGLGLFRLWPLSRWLALRLAGRRERAGDWKAVWDRRAEWQNGWPPLAAGE